MDRNDTSKKPDAEIFMSPEAFEEKRITLETTAFDYWLKAPTWGAKDAAILLYLRVSPDYAYMEFGPKNVERVIYDLLRHFEVFGLICIIGGSFTKGINVSDNKLPPSEWIKCYRDYPGAKPLPFDDPMPATR